MTSNPSPASSKSDDRLSLPVTLTLPHGYSLQYTEAVVRGAISAALHIQPHPAVLLQVKHDNPAPASHSALTEEEQFGHQSDSAPDVSELAHAIFDEGDHALDTLNSPDDRLPVPLEEGGSCWEDELTTVCSESEGSESNLLASEHQACSEKEPYFTFLTLIKPNIESVIKLSIPAVNADGTITVPVMYRPVTHWHIPTSTHRTRRHELTITLEEVEEYPWLKSIIHQIKTSYTTSRSISPFLHLIAHMMEWNSIKCKTAESISQVFETVEMLQDFELTLQHFGFSRQRSFMTLMSKIISLSKTLEIGDLTVLTGLAAHVSTQLRELRAALQIHRDQTTDSVLAGQQKWLTQEQFGGLHAVVSCVAQGAHPTSDLCNTVEYAEFARDCLVLYLSYVIGMQRGQVWRRMVITQNLSKHTHDVCLFKCSSDKYLVQITQEKNSLSRGTHRVLHISGEHAHALDLYMSKMRTCIIGVDSDCALVFPAKCGKPLTQTMFCTRLQFILYALFGVNLTSQMIRKVFESHFLQVASSPEEMRAITEKFGNESVTAALNYRVPIDPRTEQDNGWHVVFKWLTTVPDVTETDNVWVLRHEETQAVCEEELGQEDGSSPAPRLFSASELLLQIPVHDGWKLCLPKLTKHGVVESPKRWSIGNEPVGHQSPFKRARTSMPSILSQCSECPALNKILDHVLASRVSKAAKAELKSSLKHLCWRADLKEAGSILELFPAQSTSLQSFEVLHKSYSDSTMRNIMLAGMEACKAYLDLNLLDAAKRGELLGLEKMFTSRYVHFRSHQARRRYMLCHNEHTLPTDSPVHHVHFAGAFQTCLQVLEALSAIPAGSHWTDMEVCYIFQRLLFVCIFLSVAPLPTTVYARITVDHVHFQELTGLFQIDFPVSKGRSDITVCLHVPSQLTASLHTFLSVARKALSPTTSSFFCNRQHCALSSSELTLLFKTTFTQLWGFSLCPSDARIAIKAWIEKGCSCDLTSAQATQIRNRLGLAFSSLTKHATSTIALATPLCHTVLESKVLGVSNVACSLETSTEMGALHHVQQTPVTQAPRSTQRAFLKNKRNSCLEDSFLACMASALQFVSVMDLHTDPTHIRQLYHASTKLLRYWCTGEHALLDDAQQSVDSLRENVSKFITAICEQRASYAVPPSPGRFLELANWLKCFGESDTEMQHSFMAIAEAKLTRETRCIHDHIIIESMQGSGTFEIFKQTKRKGADAYWYMEPGGLGLDGVNTVYGKEGMIVKCPTCKAGAVRTWAFQHAPQLLFVEIGGSNSFYPYNRAPFTVEVLGYVYRLFAIIQNSRNVHFRAVVEISGKWHICDDRDEQIIPLPALSAQSPSAAWTDGLHVFAKVGTCSRPISASTMELESVRGAVAEEQHSKTLHGLTVATQRIVCGSEKDKHDAMCSLLTSYMIDMDDVLSIIHDPSALRGNRHCMNDVLATMARKMYSIICKNEQQLQAVK